jgi:hypothetical protein
MKSMPKKSTVHTVVVSNQNDTEHVRFPSSRNKDGSISQSNDTGVLIAITSSMIHSLPSVCSSTR